MKKAIDIPMAIFISITSYIWIIFSMNTFKEYGQFTNVSQMICNKYNLLGAMEVERGCFIAGYIAMLTPFLLMFIFWTLIPRVFKKTYRALYHVFTSLLMLPFAAVSFFSIPRVLYHLYPETGYENLMNSTMMWNAYSLNRRIIFGCFFIIVLLEIYVLARDLGKIKDTGEIKKAVARYLSVGLLSIFVVVMEACILSLWGLRNEGQVNEVINWLTEYAPLVTGCLVMVVVAPLVEEIIFRGVIFKSLHKYGPAWFTYPLSAILWAIWHGSMAQALYIIPLGILLAHVYTKTNRLRFSVLIHSLSNMLVNVSFFEGGSHIRIPKASWFVKLKNYIFAASTLKTCILLLLAFVGMYFVFWMWVTCADKKDK